MYAYMYMFDAILAKQHSCGKKNFLALCFRYSQSPVPELF